MSGAPKNYEELLGGWVTDRWQNLDGSWSQSSHSSCEQFGGGRWYDGSEGIPRRESKTGFKGEVTEHYGLQHDRSIQKVQKDSALERAMLEHQALVQGALR